MSKDREVQNAEELLRTARETRKALRKQQDLSMAERREREKIKISDTSQKKK